MPLPMDDSAILPAADWVRSLLLGSVATSVAVIAVAVIGLLLLSGRIPVRRGLTAIVGCFVLFSAGTIADGLLSTVRSTPSSTIPLAPVPPPVAALRPPVDRTPYDPYAGASVPIDRGRQSFEP